eukprot:scaffold1117_cov167-Amphora_coffeaeformis.AAC.1
MMCVKLAEQQGHRVLFQPPHHSDLQPIELLWAKLKGNIGRQYNSDTTMVVLKQRLDEQFEQAKQWHESVEGFVRKTTALAAEFYEKALADDEHCSDFDDANSSGSDSDSSDDMIMDEDLEGVIAL